MIVKKGKYDTTPLETLRLIQELGGSATSTELIQITGLVKNVIFYHLHKLKENGMVEDHITPLLPKKAKVWVITRKGVLTVENMGQNAVTDYDRPAVITI